MPSNETRATVDQQGEVELHDLVQLGSDALSDRRARCGNVDIHSFRGVVSVLRELDRVVGTSRLTADGLHWIMFQIASRESPDSSIEFETFGADHRAAVLALHYSGVVDARDGMVSVSYWGRELDDMLWAIEGKNPDVSSAA